MATYLTGLSMKPVAVELGLKAEHVCRLVEERGAKRSPREARRLAASAAGSQPPAQCPAGLAAEVVDRYAVGESEISITESLGLAVGGCWTIAACSNRAAGRRYFRPGRSGAANRYRCVLRFFKGTEQEDPCYSV